MEKIQSLYHANQYHCIKDYIWEGIQQYSKNIAFRIKDKKEKVVCTIWSANQTTRNWFIKIRAKGQKNCYHWKELL